ncbi:MAG: hypothetical protein GY845_09325 [Planctomycetes bacterium]|nr:hypothetical protein [Planctomycetota bacterium]
MKEGGLATLAKYGTDHFRRIGSLPPKPGNRRRGRPTRIEECEAYWAEQEAQSKAKKRRRGIKGGWRSNPPASLFEIKTQ